jgi:hypothetical protein
LVFSGSFGKLEIPRILDSAPEGEEKTQLVLEVNGVSPRNPG